MKQEMLLRVFSICLVGLLTFGLYLVPSTQAQSGGGSSTSNEQRIRDAANWIMRNSDAAGCTIAEFIGSVTSIKEIRNETSETVRLWKIDEKLGFSSQSWEVAPNSNITGDFWIPWADNTEQYQHHRMTISVGNQRDFVHFWQSGPNVRFSAGREFVDNAPSVPGVSKSGGDRTLVIGRANGQPTFVLAGRACPQFR